MRHVLFATALALAACGPTPDEVEQITEAASAADLPRE